MLAVAESQTQNTYGHQPPQSQIVGVGGCPAVVTQWQSTGSSRQVSWVWLLVTASLSSIFAS